MDISFSINDRRLKAVAFAEPMDGTIVFEIAKRVLCEQGDIVRLGIRLAGVLSEVEALVLQNTERVLHLRFIGVRVDGS
jgi:hypothetical protein